MCHKRLFHDGGQHRSLILMALSHADQEPVAGEVSVLHSESQTLQEAQASPIQ
jgi:hypothetical protein